MAMGIQSIVVIGLGSMGRRRIRLLKDIDANIAVSGVDQNAERREQAMKEFNINTYSNLEEVISGTQGRPEAAVISTSPLSHAQLIKECLNCGLHVFTEINLVSDSYEENIRLAAFQKRVLFLSSTFLYREEIQYIRNEVEHSSSGLSYSYHIGQYLPDWHPWENYMNFFVGDRRTNGCREIFAIELPWLIKTFGMIKSCKILKGKMSELKIDYPDTYHLLLEHENKTMGSMQVDVVSRKAVRNLEIYGEDLYMSWDGSPSGLKRYNYTVKETEDIFLYEKAEHLDGYSSFIIENAYRNELRVFLEEIKGKDLARYRFQDDIDTLKWINKIEQEV